MSKSKGDRRERQARSCFEEAGYAVETPTQAGKYNTDGLDFFGLFDGIATDGSRMYFYQVKSNQSRGIKDWATKASVKVPIYCRILYLVCHDREGWRAAEVTSGGYDWVVDEREPDVDMGDGLTEWLRHA